MHTNFDKWTILKLIEVILTVSCLVFKRVTDDEATKIFLILQRLSREWRLLNNVTWNRVGAAVADVTYGGYFIITFALFFGRLFEEIPTPKRITEFILLGIGAILFIVLGGLELAALDSVPNDLVDNAAILGCVSLITGALFLLDMGGPRAMKMPKMPPMKLVETKSFTQQVYDIEKELEKSQLESSRKLPRINGVKKNRFQKPKFDIYGNDYVGEQSETDLDIPPTMEQHSPVWSKIRKGEYGNYDIKTPNLSRIKKEVDKRVPNTPSDPGYVQYTAQHWEEKNKKSPTQV